MQQENRSSSPPYSKTKVATAPQGSPRPAAKAQAGAKPAETLSAMMLDYRSWWNLPRARSKKAV